MQLIVACRRAVHEIDKGVQQGQLPAARQPHANIDWYLPPNQSSTYKLGETSTGVAIPGICNTALQVLLVKVILPGTVVVVSGGGAGSVAAAAAGGVAASQF